ncbi:ATPase domain-containing protein, partial [Haloferax profundi]
MSSQFSLGLSGHDRLEKELGGGMPKGAIVLIEGDYGAGKSVLSQRFSYGFCQEDTVVTLVSTELGVRGFLDQMHSLSYDVVKHLLNEEILFLQAEIDSSGALSGGQQERKQLLRRLMDAETLWDADVIIIDTFDA